MSSARTEPAEWATTVAPPSAKSHAFATVFALLAWLWVLGRLVVVVTIVETLDRVTVADG